MSGDAGVFAESESADQSILPPATTREPLRERPIESESETRPIEPFYPGGDTGAEARGGVPGRAPAGEADAPERHRAGDAHATPIIELTEVVEEVGAKEADAKVLELADRLDALADRLRTDGAAAVGPELHRGDRLDTLLNGLLAGYLAAD